MPKPLITAEIADYIRANYKTCLGSDMARKFGISKSVVGTWMRKNGLYTPKEVVNLRRSSKLKGRSKVTPEQDGYILANYLTKPQKRIAEDIGVSHTCLKIRLRQLDLNIPEEVRQRFAKESQIKPGNLPFNKGKKQSEFMSPDAIARTKRTRFKKGNLPHNCYHEVGKITVRHDHPNRNSSRPYKYICIAVGDWKPLHVHNYELVNGPIPKGHCLWFKDDDTMNCDVDNLELITRQENLDRNRYADRAVATRMSVGGLGRGKVDTDLREELLRHPDLIELKRQQLMLQREIKNKNK